MLSKKILQWATIGWLFIEVGQFTAERIPWLGANELFWPLWLSLCLLISTLIRLIDLTKIVEQLKSSRPQQMRTYQQTAKPPKPPPKNRSRDSASGRSKRKRRSP